MFSQAYQAIAGNPFVYNKVRPMLLGGLDLSPFYLRLNAGPEDVTLDIGCGTGSALDYLDESTAYRGFDTDSVAIEAARRKPLAGRDATFSCAKCTTDDVRRIDPTLIVLCGVLHHLSDDEAIDIMRMATAAPRFQQMFTLDVTLLPGPKHIASNVLAKLDRGRHVRRPDGYRALIERAGFVVQSAELLWNHPKRHIARYYVTTIERGP